MGDGPVAREVEKVVERLRLCLEALSREAKAQDSRVAAERLRDALREEVGRLDQLLQTQAGKPQVRKPAPTVEAKAPVEGTWKWSTQRKGEMVTMAVKLKQDGPKLSGVYVSREGDETPISAGKVADNKVSFTVVRELRQKVIYHYEGIITGDTITGTVESDRSGTTNSRAWEAKRTKG